MYNEERKKEFIESYYNTDGSKTTATVWFSRMFEPKEIELNKDLCEFDRKTIIKVYEGSNCASMTLSIINSIAKNYTDWCVKNGFVEENPYNDITLYDLIASAPDKKIYSMQEIIDVSESFDNDGDKFIILAPFFGFSSVNSYRDYTDLKLSDVDCESGVIKLHNRNITVPEWFARLTAACFKADHYIIWMDGDGDKRVDVGYPLVGDGVIKFKANAESGDVGTYIRNKYARKIKKTLNITYSDITNSGIVYYSKCIVREKEFKNFDQLWASKDFKENVLGRFEKPAYRKTIFRNEFERHIFAEP